MAKNTNTDILGGAITLEQIQALLASGNTEEAKKLFEAKKLQDEIAAAQRAESAAQNEQRQKLLAIEDAIRTQEAVQEACLHTKPNNQPAIAGTRDSSGAVIFICLNCNKIFNQKTLPYHLRTSLPPIGGPTVTSGE